MDGGPRNSGGKMSLMDIQAEQERERNAASSSQYNHNNSGGGGRRGSSGPRGGSYHNSGNSNNNYHRNSSGGGGGGGGRRHSRRGSDRDRSSLPLERGCICSLKEKFGFIHCADRPSEIFFHYSEVNSPHPDHLQLDDEVEFRVGKSRDNPDKLAALEVIQLPTGTIEWEYEESPGERFQGLIDRPLLRSGGSNNGRINNNNDNNNANSMEGLIRLLVPAEDAVKEEEGDEAAAEKGDDGGNSNKKKETTAPDTMTASDGPKIRFTANDYTPEPQETGDTGGGRRNSTGSSSNPNRLYRGDLVEFTLVVEKRTRQKFARNIVLLQSERERARLAKEEQMLANATLERGVVVSLKQDFGFLRSNARRDEVYFHYSQITLPEKKKEENKDGNDDGGDDDYELKVGQEMEFLVVTEEVEERSNSSGGGGGGFRRIKTSARKVKFLPKGTVEFEKLIAEGITGVVSIVPRADAGRDQRRERDPQSLGTIRLPKPLSTKDPTVKDAESAETVEVKKVLLDVADAPGGLFSCARGAAMGLWIREGDTLLFDVMYDFVEKSYYAKPTKHLVPVGSELASKVSEGTATVEPVDGKENADNRAGSKEDVGKEDTENNSNNNGSNGSNHKGKINKKQSGGSTGAAVRLVQLCLAGRAEGMVHTTKEAYGFIHFAERPVDVHFKLFEILPDEIQEDLRRNMGLTMTLNTKAEMMGHHTLGVGTEVQFDLSLQGTVMTQNQHNNRGGKRGGNQHERENLKAQRILILPKGTIMQNFTIGLGMKGTIISEDPNQPYAGTLELEEERKQMSIEKRHPLVSQMLDQFMEDKDSDSLVFHDIQTLKEEDVVAEMIECKGLGPKLELSYIPQPGESQGRLCIRKVDEQKASVEGPKADGEAAGDEAKQETKKEEAAPKGPQRSKSPKGGRSKSPKGRASKKKKALQQKIQPIKTIRYDKSSLQQNAKTDVPAGAGDVIVCDLHQNRRTGKTHLENLSVVERKVVDAAEAATLEGATGIGVVKEVVNASKFGFISVADETATKRELLFFHFASVTEGHRPNHNASQGRNKKGGSGSADAIIRKGDEVEFKIGTENGKRVAVDIKVTSAGVIPNKVDKNACRGYIMVEPTDTKVGTTPKPSRSFTRSRDAPQKGSRWDNSNAKDEDHLDKLANKGEGVILLLEDPSDMFASVVEKFVGKKEENQSKKPSSAQGLGKCHLHYQNGALALHGAGAPTTMDSSTHPRRGDLVSFVKSKSNASGARDIRVVTRAQATLIRGKLENIQKNTAKFVGTGANAKEYEVQLREVVSCDPSQLKNGVEVEGILHGDAVHGLCRITDLRLETKLGTGRKERPKLNLTVKKDRGGTIMAQSMMAKGPDGTTGFPSGWTTRVSQYAS